jgi:two-component system, NarL family, sensor histidine kinase DegS
MSGPLYSGNMDGTRAEARDGRIDELHAEAKAAVGYAADSLRQIAERYRTLQHADLVRLQDLRDRLRAGERGSADIDRNSAPPVGGGDAAAEAAEAGAEEGRRRAIRSEQDTLADAVGRQESELNRLDAALKSLERTWLFLGREDATLIGDMGPVVSTSEMNMRIVEAQESERLRIVREVHDGPAQALSNAIFQIDYVGRVMVDDPPAAQQELRLVGERLRRDLDEARSFISQSRPAVLAELGLAGSIIDVVERFSALTGIALTTEIEAGGEQLSEADQTVVLRIVQEALQNTRKHAAASSAVVATRLTDGDWVLEVRDDGRGFDVGSMAARGRRNFGLQFMRERAELIGARFDVGSRPNGGTVVRLAIPLQKENE